MVSIGLYVNILTDEDHGPTVNLYVKILTLGQKYKYQLCMVCSSRAVYSTLPSEVWLDFN